MHPELDKTMLILDYVALEKRVRDLHKSFKHIYGKVACAECGQRYPCNTIKILDGEQ